MEKRFIPENILAYCDLNSSALGALPESILAQADAVDRGYMMVGTHVGRLLQCLVLSRQPKRTLEIGTFHGFSAAAIAEVLPSECKLICCERNSELAAISAKNLEGKNITLIECDGIEYLKQNPAQFDFIFIDADKGCFWREIDLLYERLGQRGILVVDNALAGLAVLDDNPEKDWERQTKAFNSSLCSDPRFFVLLMPIRDGVTIAVKR